ncbi:interferon gamma 1-like [Pholidichthys leucotaenia]
MSLCSGSVWLLVLLGAVLTLGVPCQYVSMKLKHTFETIGKELELRHPDVGSNPLFGSVLRSINTSCQRTDDLQLMSTTLDVYMRIFASILHSNHHQDDTQTSTGLLDQLSSDSKRSVEMAVKKYKEWVQHLKNHLTQQMNHKEDILNKLKIIKVDDPTVQRKALAEFMEVYQAASVVGNVRC